MVVEGVCINGVLNIANFEFLEQVGAKYTWEHADEPAPEPARGGNYGLGRLDLMGPLPKGGEAATESCNTFAP